MMEKWNQTMENMDGYVKKQSDMCIENDSIPKALYADYGVKRACVMRTDREFLQDLQTYQA